MELHSPVDLSPTAGLSSSRRRNTSQSDSYPPSQSEGEEDDKSHGGFSLPAPRSCIRFLLCVLAVSTTLLWWTSTMSTNAPLLGTRPPSLPFCKGRFIYIHKLSPDFNLNLIRNCRRLLPSRSLCRYMANQGLGPKVWAGALSRLVKRGTQEGSWFDTSEDILEYYFFTRLHHYPCVTDDPAAASAFYIPFFPLLDSFYRHTNQLNKTGGVNALFAELRANEYFIRRGGSDHFLVMGRGAEEFLSNSSSGWGNQVLLHPAAGEVIRLSPERSYKWPAQRRVHPEERELSIPHLTAFHPLSWTNGVKELGLAAGGVRPFRVALVASAKRSKLAQVRTFVARQCDAAPDCIHVTCIPTRIREGEVALEGRNNSVAFCSMDKIRRVYRAATFCLQPPGDSAVRKGIFDSLLSGCIPVFLHEHSLAGQYVAHLPPPVKAHAWAIALRDKDMGRGSVIRHLNGVNRNRVEALQEQGRALLPNIVYSPPWKVYGGEGAEGGVGGDAGAEIEPPDAFDLAMDGSKTGIEGGKGWFEAYV